MNHKILSLFALLVISMTARAQITVSEDTYSSYAPTQLLNGTFDTEPWMDYVYQGVLYTTHPNPPLKINRIPNGSIDYSIPHGTGEGWNTTETRPWSSLFEYSTNMGQYNTTLNTNGNNAGHGGFIEMNAESSAVLYQDLPTFGNDVIRWTLDHAVRITDAPNTQSLRVEIGAPERDENNNIIYASGINDATDAHIIDNTEAFYDAIGYRGNNGYGHESLTYLTLYKNLQSDNWYTITGVYSVPEGQTVTRFAFTATQVTQQTTGNLLDNLTFSTLIGNLSAVYNTDGSVTMRGYWGDSDNTKKIEIKIGETVYHVDMSSVLNKNFMVHIPIDIVGSATQVQVYHQDYTSAKQTINITHNVTLTDVSATAITYGQTLGYSTISGTAKHGTTTVPGIFTWTDNTIEPQVSDSQTTAYDVTFTPTDASTYNTATTTVKLTVNKANSTLTTLPTAKTLTYNGSAQALVNEGTASGGTLQYKLGDGSYSTTIPTATDAGTYTVYYKVVGDANHNDTEEASVSVTIAKAQLTEVLLEKANFTYSGSEQTATITHVTAGTMTVPASGYTVSGDKNTNVGNYTLTVTGKGNFEGTATGHYSIVAAEANLFTLTIDQTSLTYDGTEKKPAVTVKDGEKTLTIDIDYTLAYENNVNAGTAKVTATGIGNYAGTKVAEFTINKAAATITTAPTAKSLTYNAEAQQLVNAGITTDGILKYSLDNSTWNTLIPQATDAGIYTVYCKVVGDANHTDTDGASVAVTIDQAQLTEVLLDKANFIYNQATQTATVKHVTAGTLTVPSNGYDVSGDKNTNVGNYMLTVTGKGNYKGTATGYYSIVAAGAQQFTLTIDETSLTYDGTEKKPAVTVKDGEKTLTIDKDYTLTYENNVNAGTAKVTATGMGNYAGTKVAEFTISKAAAAVTTAPTPKTLTYNAEAQRLVIAGVVSGGLLNYSLDNSTWNAVIPQATDAGAYTVYYKVVGDANHTDTEAASVAVTIAQAELTEVLLNNANLTYTGYEQTVSVKHVTAGTLTVTASGYNVSGDKATDKGNYTLTVTGKGNYKGTATGYYSIVAAGAQQFTLTVDETSLTYDGTEKKPAVTVKDGEKTLTIDVDYTLVYENNVNAGTGKVTVTGMGNYAGTKVAEFTISKAAATITTAPEKKMLTYSGEAQQLVNAGITTDGILNYSLDNSTWNAVIPQATDAGTYTVYYKVVGDANHTDTEAASVSVTIAQAQLTEVLLNNANLTYTGYEQTVSVKHVTAGTLTVPVSDYNVSGDKATDKGNYTLTVTGKGNFTGTATGYYSIVAANAYLFTLTLDETSVTYDGTEKKPAVTVKDGNTTLVLDKDYTLTYENNVHAGTGKVTATGMGNYEGTKVAEFTINKAAATLTTLPETKALTYSAEARRLVNAGVASGGTINYSLDNSTWSTMIPQATDAGTYTVYYKVVGDANHTDTETASVAVTIAQAELTEVLLNNPDLIYTGNEQAATIKHVTAGTLTVPASDYNVSGDKATNKGNYTLTVTGKGNYKGTATGHYSIVAADAKQITLTLDQASFTYDGTEKKPAVTVKDGEKTLTIDVDYTLTYENNVNAGMGKVTVTGIGNYAGTKVAEFTINKADITTITAPTGKSQFFTEAAQELIVAGTAVGGEMQYSLTKNARFSTTIPQATKVGTYKVYYIIKADQNHNDVAVDSVVATIKGIPLTIPAREYATFYYPENTKTNTVGAEIYAVTGVSDGKATIEKIEGVVPAEMPVLVKNTTEAELTVIIVPTSEVATTTVKPSYELKGSDTGALIPESTEARSYYVCNGLQFVRVEEAGYLAANRCWLEIVTVPAAASRRSIIIGEGTTGVNEALGDEELRMKNEESAGAWYDMSGRKLSGKPSAKGLYILNGKKVVVR